MSLQRKFFWTPIQVLFFACGVIVAAFPCVAGAEDAPKSPVTTKPVASCWDKATTQSEMTDCAATDARAADEKLNRSYQAVVCHLDAKEKTALRAAQRAWIAFRDADCAFWGGGGGSIAPMNELSCRAALSNVRAKDLDNWPPNAPRDALAPCG